MTSFVSGDSTIGDYPLSQESPLVTRNSDGGLNIDTRNPVMGSVMGVNLTSEGGGDDNIFTSDASDIVDAGVGDDIVFAGGDADFVFGADGNDIIRGGDGDDVIRGGKGADVLIGGSGSDTFLIRGEDLDGSTDAILDFDQSEEDVLILQEIPLQGVGEVSYDSDSGDVILTDDSGASVIANLPTDLDITVIDQGDGNWTLL